MAEEVRFIASVEPSVQTTIGAEVAGRVAEMLAREGHRVAQGGAGPPGHRAPRDPVPRGAGPRRTRRARNRTSSATDPGTRRWRSERRRPSRRLSSYASSKTTRGPRKLAQDNIISLAELQGAESQFRASQQRHQRALEALRMARAGPRAEDIAQAETELAGAQARADRITDEIRRSVIVTPTTTGFVVRKRVDIGGWVQPGTSVVDLVALDPVHITGPVGEREIRRIAVGQPAAITVDAYPGSTFTGHVTAVVPEADAASRSFPVKVTVPNPDACLKDAQQALTRRRRPAPAVTPVEAHPEI